MFCVQDHHREASGDADMAPVERRIEARTEESKTSMVRFLYFANTFVRDRKYL